MSDSLKDLNKLLKETLGLLKDLGPQIKSTTGGGGGTSSGMGGGGTGGVGSGSTKMLGGALAPVNSVAAGWNVVNGAVKTIGGLYGATTAGLPDVALTMARESAYYGAGQMTAGIMGRGMLQSTTRLGLGKFATSAGSDANVAAIMAGQGMVPGTAAFRNTVTGVGQAARYMNMPNEVAAGALAGLGNGASSGNMMSKFGVFTSDMQTGKELTQGQIFEQFAQRAYVGGQGDSANTLQDIRRGFVGSAIRNSGMDTSQQEMLKAYLVERARGNKLDFSDPKAISKIMGQNKAAGYENPFLSAYKVNSVETRNMETFTKPYIKGIKDASDALVSFKDAVNLVNPAIAQQKAYFDTLFGDKGIVGVTTSIGALIAGIAQAAIALKAFSMLGGMKLPGGIAGPVGTAGSAGTAGNAARAAADARRAAGMGEIIAGSETLGLGGLAATAAVAAIPAAFLVAGAGAMYHNAIIGGKMNHSKKFRAQYMKSQAATILHAKDNSSTGFISSTDYLSGGANTGSGYTGNMSVMGSPTAGKKTGGPTSTVGTGTSTDTTKSLKLMAPVKGPITCKFGTKDDLHPNGHRGTDFGVSAGTPVMAAGDGTVAEVYWSNAIGNVVVINHGGGYSTLYAHLSQALVSPKTKVKMGNMIAKSGNTGSLTTGAHLHFEVRKNGTPVSPVPFLGPGVALTAGNWKKTSTSGPSNMSNVGISAKGQSVGLNITGDLLAEGYSFANSNMSTSTVGSGLVNSAAIPPAYTGASSANPGSSISIGRSQRAGMAGTNGAGSTTGTGGPETDALVLAKVKSHRGATTDAPAGETTTVTHTHNNQVAITLKIANASESEAKKFAEIVKREIEKQSMMDRMSRR